MCGIAGAFYSSKQNDRQAASLDKLLTRIAHTEKDPSNAASLLDLAWEFKTNASFIAFCKSDYRRRVCAEASLKIDAVIKILNRKIEGLEDFVDVNEHKLLIDQIEQLRDASWFLSHELQSWRTSIASLCNCEIEELSDESLILYLNIHKVISAIDNRLEIRGRDSFGLAIMLNSKSFTGNEILPTDNEAAQIRCCFSNESETASYLITFRHFSNIGELGENARTLRHLIKSHSDFQTLVQSESVETATIVAHTRWASVGAIDIFNTLPLSLEARRPDAKPKVLIAAALNGDIYNYSDIIAQTKKRSYWNEINKPRCTSDALAIPAKLLQSASTNGTDLDLLMRDLHGSFVISLQTSDNPETVHIIKKGAQGLYLGISEDGIMFASDIYGLVESTRHFFSVKSGVSTSITASAQPNLMNPNFKLFDHATAKPITLTANDFGITSITTRDISKQHYDHFLEKEIYETPDIILKTLNLLIQRKKNPRDGKQNHHILIDHQQVPQFVKNDLTSGKIKKIIITGMGTCYTAAVAISYFMRIRLKGLRDDLLIEPHVASEGSGFYLEPSMTDTLVIVIAQSGTTIDTNVFARMAKERGARTLALANKRDGDVTFLVDGCLYIGNGRDIEIAVPSTKTFTAHVFLGYLLTSYFAQLLAAHPEQTELTRLDLDQMIEAQNLIENSLSRLKRNSIHATMYAQASKTNSWLVVYDNSSSSACAQEIRIKFSESCYQSIATLTMEETLHSGIANSFIIIVSEKSITELEKAFTHLLGNSNKVSFIANGPQEKHILKPYRDAGALNIIEMPHASPLFTFIPTVIAGQVLSYRLALALDQRKRFYANIITEMDDPDNFANACQALKTAIDNGEMTQGLKANDLSTLMSQLHDTQIPVSGEEGDNLRSKLSYLHEQTRRTIDTVKHQAKTITVGAVRNQERTQNNTNVWRRGEAELSGPEFTPGASKTYEASVESLNLSSIEEQSEILVFAPSLDESIAYNVVNFVNEHTKLCKIPVTLRLARPYDFQTDKPSNRTQWFYLKTSKNEKPPAGFDLTKLDGCPIFCFEDWQNDRTSIAQHVDFSRNSMGTWQALWSLDLSIFLTRRIVLSSHLATGGVHTQHQTIFGQIQNGFSELMQSLSTVESSSDIKAAISYGAECFISRSNWKCIGSGTNYNIAKFAARHLIEVTSRSCAFDVLENHKHIDMSAESSIITFVAHIDDIGYQDDAFSEIEKMVSHKSLPIIITNEFDCRFDNLHVSLDNPISGVQKVRVPTIKLAWVNDKFAMPLNALIVSSLAAAVAKTGLSVA